MELVRKHLYADGTPPADWDEARDGSILKELLKQRSAKEVAIAIEGVALVRDCPGVYADAVDWLRPGEKITLRTLYNSKSGVLTMFTLATQAYWKHANSRGTSGNERPAAHISDVEALRKAQPGTG